MTTDENDFDTYDELVASLRGAQPTEKLIIVRAANGKWRRLAKLELLGPVPMLIKPRAGERCA